MYNLANLALGMIAVFIGLQQSESAPLWNFMLAIGGAYIGHAITQALNDPTDDSE
jgi:uncharacterized membrane protein YeaQ/YmgE (transglycosylase-associated protein family)